MPDFAVGSLVVGRLAMVNGAARLDDLRPLDLVGVAEVSRIFGVSRQRVSELDDEGKMPAAAARIAAGPVWLRADIDAADRARRARSPRAYAAAAAAVAGSGA